MSELDQETQAQLEQMKRESAQQDFIDRHYQVTIRCRNCAFTGEVYVPKGQLVERQNCPKCSCKTIGLDHNIHGERPF